MKILEIKQCLDCPFVLPSQYENEAAYCKKYGKSISSLKTIPAWCPLEDAPGQSALDIIGKQTHELPVIRNGLERLRHDTDWQSVEEVEAFIDGLLMVVKK